MVKGVMQKSGIGTSASKSTEVDALLVLNHVKPHDAPSTKTQLADVPNVDHYGSMRKENIERVPTFKLWLKTLVGKVDLLYRERALCFLYSTIALVFLRSPPRVKQTTTLRRVIDKIREQQSEEAAGKAFGLMEEMTSRKSEAASLFSRGRKFFWSLV